MLVVHGKARLILVRFVDPRSGSSTSDQGTAFIVPLAPNDPVAAFCKPLTAASLSSHHCSLVKSNVSFVLIVPTMLGIHSSKATSARLVNSTFNNYLLTSSVLASACDSLWH